MFFKIFNHAFNVFRRAFRSNRSNPLIHKVTDLQPETFLKIYLGGTDFFQ